MLNILSRVLISIKLYEVYICLLPPPSIVEFIKKIHPVDIIVVDRR